MVWTLMSVQATWPKSNARTLKIVVIAKVLSDSIFLMNVGIRHPTFLIVRVLVYGKNKSRPTAVWQLICLFLRDLVLTTLA